METHDSKSKSRISRRKFVRHAAVGAAAAGAAITLKDATGSSGRVMAQSGTQDATVTVDALLLTYISSPDGSMGNSTLTLSNTFTSTFRLQAASDLSLSIGTSAQFTSGGFSVGGSSTFNQGVSSQVTDAVTINNMQSIAVSTPSPGQPNHTVFYGLLTPTVHFNGNPTPLLFKFLNAGNVFSARADNLQQGTWSSIISQSTVNAMLAQYPPLTDPTGSTVIKPRFKKRFSLTADTGVSHTVNFSTATGTSFSDQLTASFGATITAMAGFTDGGLQIKFSAGATLNFKITSVQELTSNQIMSISFVINPITGPRVYKVYRDKIFKT